MGNKITRDEKVATAVFSIAGAPSEEIENCTLVSSNQKNKVYQDNRDPEAFYLKNQVDEILSKLRQEEIVELVRMEKRLPSSIMPLMYTVENHSNAQTSAVSFMTRISPITLETELDRLREQGMTFNEQDVWAIMGVLLLTGSYMERGMNYHKAICLKNVFVSESRHQIFLLNPFVLDAYLEGVLGDIIVPLLQQPGWRDEYWADQQLREQAALHYPEIKKILRTPAMNTHQMMVSIALLGLQLASGLNEEYFLAESMGTLDKMRIHQALDSIRPRYSGTLVTFFRGIFSSLQRGELLSPTTILNNQSTHNKTLINKSVSESAYTNEIFAETDDGSSKIGGVTLIESSKLN